MKAYTVKLAAVTLAGLLATAATPIRVALAQQPATTAAAPSPRQPTAAHVKQKNGARDQSGVDAPRTDVPKETLANRHESQSEEERQIVPYYNNFMSTYRLGPEDVISITVFNQDRYSVKNITVPPDGLVSHPLIPEGVFVAGKTTRQVAEEIAKRLDEYIIDPKVTVSLEKAQSAVFWVLGDVLQPGIRPMTRRLTVSEALAVAGGVLPTGNKKKIAILRRQPDGYVQPTFVDLAAINRGKVPDNYFLSPGDQVVVSGNTFKKVQQVLSFLPVISFFRIFTGGGF